MKLAIISDIHANLEAFDAVLKEIKNRKIRKIFCLGDIVDYGANSNECVDLIRKNKIPTIMGNHDLTAVTFERIEWFNELAQISVKITNKLLTEKNKKFLLNLPKIIKHENMFLAHGSPRDYLYEYVYPDTPGFIFKYFLKITKKQIIAFGHTHIPFIKKVGKGLIINAGSVGQPRDGNNKACFCILDNEKVKTFSSTKKSAKLISCVPKIQRIFQDIKSTEYFLYNKKLKAEIVRVEYDISKAAEKMLKIGMPNFLAERLFQGI